MSGFGARSLRENPEGIPVFDHVHRRSDRTHIHISAIYRKTVHLGKCPPQKFVLKQFLLPHKMQLPVRDTHGQRQGIQRRLMIAHQDHRLALGDIFPALDAHEKEDAGNKEIQPCDDRIQKRSAWPLSMFHRHSSQRQ